MNSQSRFNAWNNTLEQEAKETMTANENCCAFTGHRPKSFPWKYNEADRDCVLLKEVLAEQIAALAERGVTDWFSGMALGGRSLGIGNRPGNARKKFRAETALYLALRRAGR